MDTQIHKHKVLNEVYTPEILKDIEQRAKTDPGLQNLNSRLQSHNKYLVYYRIHLDKCLMFAKEHDALDSDKLSRLRQPQNFHTWQSVYNELLVPYFFTKVFKLQIEFVMQPQRKGLGDFQVIHPKGRVIVEVKTPKGDDPNLQGPKESVRTGWDDDLLESAFFDGAKQLVRGNKNLVVICTQLCAWIHDTDAFEKLFYGQEVITREYNPDLGIAVGPTETKFVPDGELHRHKPKRFTRISAIAAFMEDVQLSEYIQQVYFAVFHNYFTPCPIDPSVFKHAEQFVPDRNRRAIKHINEKNSCILLYSGETKFANLILRLKNYMYSWFRKLRWLYCLIKMRRIARQRNKVQ